MAERAGARDFQQIILYFPSITLSRLCCVGNRLPRSVHAQLRRFGPQPGPTGYATGRFSLELHCDKATRTTVSVMISGTSADGKNPSTDSHLNTDYTRLRPASLQTLYPATPQINLIDLFYCAAQFIKSCVSYRAFYFHTATAGRLFIVVFV